MECFSNTSLKQLINILDTTVSFLVYHEGQSEQVRLFPVGKGDFQDLKDAIKGWRSQKLSRVRLYASGFVFIGDELFSEQTRIDKIVAIDI